MIEPKVTAEELHKTALDVKNQDEGPFSYPQYNQTQEYLLNRSTVIFKIAAGLSGMFGLLGLGVPYFIWLETHDYQGILFGMWFELVSIGIFFAAYQVMKNEVRAYNRIGKVHKSTLQIALPFIRIWGQIWMVLPVILAGAVLFDAFGFQSGIARLVVILMLYAGASYLFIRTLKEKEIEELQAAAPDRKEEQA